MTQKRLLQSGVTILALSLFLGACQSSPPKSGPGAKEASSFVTVRQVRIRGVGYRVWLKPGSDNYYIAETVGDSAGSQRGASAAVMRTFNCQRANMRAVDQHWRRAEGRGSFCDGFREFQPLR